MTMRLSYFLTQTDRQSAIRGTLVRLAELTPLPADQWEICLADSTDATVEYIRKELGVQITHGPTISACSGLYVLPIDENTLPAGGIPINSMISHLDASAGTGAVVGRFVAGKPAPALPTLVLRGATCFRRSVLQSVGGLSKLHGSAADYCLSCRVLAARSRIDQREDILFQTDSRRDESVPPSPCTQGEGGGEGSSSSAAGEFVAKSSSNLQAPDPREIIDRLTVLRKFLPKNLANIYWQDWSRKFKALSAHAGKRSAGYGAVLLAKLKSIQTSWDDPQPVSDEVVEAVFAFRRQAAIIGDWARRGSVWRVILADLSDNLWASHNACRSSGLQIRCVADNNPAFENLSYRDLPIVSTMRAFEGGGIDGVILTSTDPSIIESNFKSLRNHFHGPILRLWQTPREATHAQATAA